MAISAATRKRCTDATSAFTASDVGGVQRYRLRSEIITVLAGIVAVNSGGMGNFRLVKFRRKLAL